MSLSKSANGAADSHFARTFGKAEDLAEFLVTVVLRIFHDYKGPVFIAERVEHLVQVEGVGRG